MIIVCETAAGTWSYFSQWLWFAVPYCSQYLLFYIYVYSHSLPFLSHSNGICNRKYSPLEVWETARQRLCDWFDSATLTYAMSKCAGILKWVTPYDQSPVSENMCLGTCKKVWVMLRLKVTTAWYMLRHTDRTKKFTTAGLQSHKHFDCFFT